MGIDGRGKDVDNEVSYFVDMESRKKIMTHGKKYFSKLRIFKRGGKSKPNTNEKLTWDCNKAQMSSY